MGLGPSDRRNILWDIQLIEPTICEGFVNLPTNQQSLVLVVRCAGNFVAFVAPSLIERFSDWSGLAPACWCGYIGYLESLESESSREILWWNIRRYLKSTSAILCCRHNLPKGISESFPRHTKATWGAWSEATAALLWGLPCPKLVWDCRWHWWSLCLGFQCILRWMDVGEQYTVHARLSLQGDVSWF